MTRTRTPRIVGAILLVAFVGCATRRAPGLESDRIAQILRLQPGTVVADVGAGKGLWTEDLARRVGEAGHVFSTEIDEDNIEHIRSRTGNAGLRNVTLILGDPTGTGLPEACCDVILLRLVYHHFVDPAPMRASLRRSLRPDGLLAIIEIRPQDGWRPVAGVPDRGGHGISLDDLVDEMTSDGFNVVDRHEHWPGGEGKGGVKSWHGTGRSAQSHAKT